MKKRFLLKRILSVCFALTAAFGCCLAAFAANRTVSQTSDVRLIGEQLTADVDSRSAQAQEDDAPTRRTHTSGVSGFSLILLVLLIVPILLAVLPSRKLNEDARGKK